MRRKGRPRMSKKTDEETPQNVTWEKLQDYLFRSGWFISWREEEGAYLKHHFLTESLLLIPMDAVLGCAEAIELVLVSLEKIEKRSKSDLCAEILAEPDYKAMLNEVIEVMRLNVNTCPGALFGPGECPYKEKKGLCWPANRMFDSSSCWWKFLTFSGRKGR